MTTTTAAKKPVTYACFGVFFWDLEFVWFPNSKFGVFTHFHVWIFLLSVYMFWLFGFFVSLFWLTFAFIDVELCGLVREWSVHVNACVRYMWWCECAYRMLNCTFEHFYSSVGWLSSRFSFTRPLRSVDSVQNPTISQPKLDNFFSIPFVCHIEQHNYGILVLCFVCPCASSSSSASPSLLFLLQRKVYCTFCHSALYLI